MGKSLVEKIFEIHIVTGEYKTGAKVGLSIDSILTNDATGSLTFLQAELLTLDSVELENSLCTIDHSNIEIDYRFIDNQRYLQDFCYKAGINFSRAGNGVSHQVYLERFAKPGYTLLSNEVHASISGAVGMLAFSAAGVDLAAVMSGLPFFVKVPKVVRIDIKGELPPFVSAKDIALYLCRKNPFLDLHEAIFEFTGEGLINLDVHDRATIASIAAELGVMSMIFPIDDVVKDFLLREDREFDFVELKADIDAVYDDYLEIDLSTIVPLSARPHSPLNIVEVSNIEDIVVDQIVIGGCSNSSYKDIYKVAKILEGKTVSRNISLIISIASKQVLTMLSRDGVLTTLIEAGARIVELDCSTCLGFTHCPVAKGKTLRTFNMNYKGSSGTKDAEVYIVSPETAAASSIYGRIVDPRTLDGFSLDSGKVDFYNYVIDDRMIIPPMTEVKDKNVIRGSSIKSLPLFSEMPENLMGEILLKLPANVELDDMLPHSIENRLLTFDIYKTAELLFKKFDPTFFEKAKKYENSVIVADENYGQRELYEHIAIAMRYLGVFAVIAKSFTLNERNILINCGILPLIFENKKDYDLMQVNTTIILKKIKEKLLKERKIKIDYENSQIVLKTDLDEQELAIIFEGGKINYLKNKFLNK